MYSLVDKVDVVCFDVFDTSIFRKVQHPHEVFDLLGRFIRQERVTAESNAANKNPDTTLSEIYKNGSALLSEEIMSKEIELEYQLCYQNPVIYSIYNYAFKQGKKIIFISDMYLPSYLIKIMLEKCGYDKFDSLYVSCEYNARKRTGELYQKVIKDLNVTSDKMLMIGDNVESDYNQAKRNGLEAFHYIRQQTYEEFWERLGYNQIGCTVYAFAKYLKEQFKEQGIEDAYFFAREGLLYKDAFDIINDTTIKSHYLEISRKTVHFPLLANMTEEDFWNNKEYAYIKWYMVNLSSENVKAFFDYWNIDINNYIVKLIKEKIDIDLDLSSISLDTRVAIITRLTKLAFSDIQEQAKIAKEDSIKYLLSKIDFSKKIAIVDIGWGGTLQESLHRLLGKYLSNLDINGFYYGATTRIDERKQKYKINVFHYQTEVIMNNYIILEFLMSAEHGSVMGYNNENVVYNNDVKIEHRFLHKGVLEFIKDIKYMNIENPSNYGLIKLNRLFNNPTLEEAINIGNLSNYDGSDKAGIRIAKPDLSFIKKQYNNSLNKAMFMKRLQYEIANLNL